MADLIVLRDGPLDGQMVRAPEPRGDHPAVEARWCEPDPGRTDWPTYHRYAVGRDRVWRYAP